MDDRNENDDSQLSTEDLNDIDHGASGHTWFSPHYMFPPFCTFDLHVDLGRFLDEQKKRKESVDRNRRTIFQETVAQVNDVDINSERSLLQLQQSVKLIEAMHPPFGSFDSPTNLVPLLNPNVRLYMPTYESNEGAASSAAVNNSRSFTSDDSNEGAASSAAVNNSRSFTSDDSLHLRSLGVNLRMQDDEKGFE